MPQNSMFSAILSSLRRGIGHFNATNRSKFFKSRYLPAFLLFKPQPTHLCRKRSYKVASYLKMHGCLAISVVVQSGIKEDIGGILVMRLLLPLRIAECSPLKACPYDAFTIPSRTYVRLFFVQIPAPLSEYYFYIRNLIKCRIIQGFLT